jgi:hypothetical protein
MIGTSSGSLSRRQFSLRETGTGTVVRACDERPFPPNDTFGGKGLRIALLNFQGVSPGWRRHSLGVHVTTEQLQWFR